MGAWDHADTINSNQFDGNNLTNAGCNWSGFCYNYGNLSSRKPARLYIIIMKANLTCILYYVGL